MPLADIQIRGADSAQQTSSPSSFRMGDSSDEESDNETPKRPLSRARLPAISPLPILRPLTPDMESPLPSPPRQRPIRKTLDNRIIIGDYLVSDAIQSGCWGELKLGTHQITGEQVCLKFVASGCDKCAQSNLTNEVANLRRCHHPNIVQVLEVIAVSDDTVLKFDGTVLVMEFYSRGDLLEYIENGQVMDEDLARYIFRELLQVVGFCHERRVAHLDIKPEHVVFDAEYNLRLVDFGHSCCYKGNNMRTFAHRGTIPFMAPEVLVCNSSMGDIETSNGYEILPHLTPLKHSHPSCHMHDAEMSDSSPAASTCRVERKSGSGRHSPARAASPVPVLDLPVASESSSHCPAVQCVEDDFTSAPPAARAGVTRRSSVSRHCPQCSWKLELPPSPRRKQLEHLFQESYDGRAADVWSCGVLLCTLVFGSHPFEHAHHSDMRYVIFCKNPKAFWTQFARENKVQISSTLQSLLSAMMAPKSCKRASIAQVLEHPWLTAPTLSHEQFRRVMSRRYAQNHPTPKVAAPPCATPAGPAALVTPLV